TYPFDNHQHRTNSRAAARTSTTADRRCSSSIGFFSRTFRRWFAERRRATHFIRSLAPGISPDIAAAAAWRRVSEPVLPVLSAKASILAFSQSSIRILISDVFILFLLRGFHRGQCPLGLLRVFTRAWLATAGPRNFDAYEQGFAGFSSAARAVQPGRSAWLPR